MTPPDEEAERIRRAQVPRFVPTQHELTDDAAGYPDAITRAMRDAAREQQQQMEQHLAELLFEHPAGTTLCVHAPEVLNADGPELAADGYRFTMRQRVHVLQPDDVCGAPVRREQYTVPVRKKP